MFPNVLLPGFNTDPVPVSTRDHYYGAESIDFCLPECMRYNVYESVSLTHNYAMVEPDYIMRNSQRAVSLVS